MLPRFSASRLNGLFICVLRYFSSSPSRSAEMRPKRRLHAPPSEQIFEPLVYRNAIPVGQPIGLICHADDGDQLAQHLLTHAEALRRRAVRGGAVDAAIADADREVDQLLGQGVE